MRNVSLWRALLGVEKTVIEDIEFDESGELDGRTGQEPVAFDREQQPVLRTEDHAMSQPEDPRESTAGYEDTPRAGDPPVIGIVSVQ